MFRLPNVVLALLMISIGVLGLAARPATAEPAAAKPPDRIVLVGVPGLRWQDISPERTPALWRLTREASVADITVRAVETPSCPVDGWLTISKSDLATGGDPGCPPPKPPGTDGKIAGWKQLEEANEASTWNASIGWLGETVDKNGECITAVGPGAALAAADSSGQVSKYRPSVDKANFGACAITIVDVNDIAAKGTRPTTAERAKAVAAADIKISETLSRIPEGTTTLVSAVSDLGTTAHLRPAMAAGPSTGDGYLFSASTRRPGLVKLTDIPPTLLDGAAIKVPPGAPDPVWRSSGVPQDTDVVAEMSRQDEAARTVQGLAIPFYIILIGGQVLAYGGLVLAARRSRTTALTATRIMSIVFASVPVGLYLVNLLPWPRVPLQSVALVGGIALVTGAVAALALSMRGLLGPICAVAAVTSVTIAVDTVTEYNLQFNSFIGLYPINAGRLYGLGNEAFAIFTTATMLFLAALGGRLNRTGRPWLAAALVVTLGAGAVAVVGLPAWGANFGGTLARIPGVAVLAVLISKARITFARVGAAVALSALAVMVISYLDHLRPPEQRSHFGDFWENAIAGNSPAVILHKLGSMLGSLGNGWVTMLVMLPVLAVLLVVLYGGRRTPRALRVAFGRAPALQTGLLAAWFTVALGFVVNDSGAAVPGLAILFGVPLAVHASIRAISSTPSAPSSTPPRDHGIVRIPSASEQFHDHGGKEKRGRE